MLFQKKEKKLALLYPENIRVGCKADTKENVIRTVGKMLVDTGYVNASYVDGMVQKEETFSTYMGDGLALPHGVEEAKREVKASGIAVMVFPDGTDWGGERARLVVGIAGVGDDHLNILAALADRMMEDGWMNRVAHATPREIYEMLKEA